MIYTVSHRTTYNYDKPVGFARCMLRLTPVSSRRQTLLANSIAVTPAPTSLRIARGAFGEETQTIVIDQSHDRFVVDARSRVDVHASSPACESPNWQAVVAAAVAVPGLGPDSPAAYLYPTRRTPLAALITDYARASFASGRDIGTAASDLMARIHADFTYDPEATTVSTPALEAFERRSGVCQDFAHIMIIGLRGLGLPAAYVSGYLRTRPPPGRPRLAGADATHAWVALWCGETCGWIGFDPTNAVHANDSHIVLATGRDYADAAPIDGIILAPGGQRLTVEVDVVPDSEVAGDDMQPYHT